MKNNQEKEKPLLELEQKFTSLIMSESDLKNLGLNDIAYIKTHKVNNKIAYVLHAADGSAIGLEVNEHSVIKDAHYQELNLVALH